MFFLKSWWLNATASSVILPSPFYEMFIHKMNIAWICTTMSWTTWLLLSCFNIRDLCINFLTTIQLYYEAFRTSFLIITIASLLLLYSFLIKQILNVYLMYTSVCVLGRNSPPGRVVASQTQSYSLQRTEFFCAN